MTAQPDVDAEVPVDVDDLLAGVRTTAELNAMIREGLAAATRVRARSRRGRDTG